MTAHTDSLIADLRILTADFALTLSQESAAIKAAQFAQALAVQDRKIHLHNRLTPLLAALKAAPKTDAQKEEARALLTEMTEAASANKKSIELGFQSIERLMGRVFSAMRRAVQKDSPRYNAGGAYHHNRGQTLTLQTDRTA